MSQPMLPAVPFIGSAAMQAGGWPGSFRDDRLNDGPKQAPLATAGLSGSQGPRAATWSTLLRKGMIRRPRLPTPAQRTDERATVLGTRTWAGRWNAT